MNVKELVKDLKSVPRLINIKGKEEVFIEQAIQTIIKTFIKKGTEDFNVTFIKDEPDNLIKTILHEAPFDNDYKLVFLKSKTNVNIPRSTICVSLDNSFRSPHLTVDCSKVYGRKLKSLIRQKAKEEGFEMDKQDIDVFIQANGTNLISLYSEITKLSLLGTVDFKSIRYLSQTNSNVRLDYLFKAIVNKNVQECLLTYYSLINNNASNSSIYGFIIYALKEVLRADKDDEDNKYSQFKPFLDENFFNNTFRIFFNIEDYIKDDSFPFYLVLRSLAKRDFSDIQNFKQLDRYGAYFEL